MKWDEWEKYTWLAGAGESAMLHSPRTFISSSGYIYYLPSGRQRLRVTFTSFLPSAEEYSPATGSPPDRRGEHMPLLVAARKRYINIHIETDRLWETQVMITEDNIIIIPVRHSPKHGVRILTLRTIAQI